MYTFPPYFKKKNFSPAFLHFPLFSFNLRVFCLIYVLFASPYFDHGAFMHHAMHVLDASVCRVGL